MKEKLEKVKEKAKNVGTKVCDFCENHYLAALVGTLGTIYAIACTATIKNQRNYYKNCLDHLDNKLDEGLHVNYVHYDKDNNEVEDEEG